MIWGLAAGGTGGGQRRLEAGLGGGPVSRGELLSILRVMMTMGSFYFFFF